MLDYIADFVTATVAAITPAQWLAAAAIGLALGALDCLIEGRRG